MKFLFLTLGDPVEIPADRYRYYYYNKYFSDAGHDVHFLPLVYRGYMHEKSRKNGLTASGMVKLASSYARRFHELLLHVREHDAVVLAKEVFKRLPYFLDQFALRGVPYTVDFDDNPQHAYETSRLARLLAGGDKIRRLVENAAAVTVGNHWYFSEFPRGRLVYQPTVVDVERYPVRADHEAAIPRLVWIGSYSTQKYLDALKPVLRRLARLQPYHLRVIGVNFSDPEIPYENVPWSEDTEAHSIHECHIGIMPLADTYWEKGKCGFKLIQYMACGLPVVASPAPANEEIVQHGENGFIARTDDEWVDFLRRLLQDVPLRARMGALSRRIVEERYSYQVWGPRYVNLLERVGRGEEIPREQV